MRLILDLTDEEIKMVCLSLENEGDKLFEMRKDREEQDRYYNLAEKFRKSGQKVIYFAKRVEE